MLEGAVALVSDALDRRRIVVGAQGLLAAALLLLACVRSARGLTFGLTFAGVASGIACGAAQSLCVSAAGQGADRAMVRWALFSTIGDVAAPLVTATAMALGFSYRGAMAAIATGVALQCAWACACLRPFEASRTPLDGASPGRLPEPCDGQRTDDSPRFFTALASAARRPRLWAWLLAAASCTLLDELIVAIEALRLEREQRVGTALVAAATVMFSCGAVAGTALSERALAKLGRHRLLLMSSLVCSASLCLLFAAQKPIAASVALFLVGVACAPHHPLAQATAYDELPDRPGTVQAIAQLFVVVDVVAPLALGLVADRFGLRAAVACLLVQPIVIAVVTVLSRRTTHPSAAP